MTSPTTPTAPSAIPGAAAIRAGIALLATFAFVLSYDALRQMAVAIHIRGLLTYTFPLVIDGFIAIGVGALLMLRTAPLRSRMYVWALVGAATVTSIWANALHAVRLNQQTRQADSLRLDDLTVGALSAIAPLALAGAVHLYLVVRRHPTPDAQQAVATSSHNHRTDATSGHNHDTSTPPPLLPLRHAHGSPEDMAAGPVDGTDGPADVASATADVPRSSRASAEPQVDEADDIPEELFAIARTAPLGRGGRASRRHIEDVIRAKKLTIGRKEADKIKRILQAELDAAAAPTQTNRDGDPVGAR
ncbi:DUF2637 domain-containing protein [Streptomyces malaysiensis]|uniref:DUF2637 domain-containing protein n=1 Tax=Streptomyces malaysiensis TaxID=92644 RepID=A0A2J7YZU9_STRMQ|nr:DUF2637 domain-containing protein [Streptomyces malaysiensis]PNG93429.1 hypothetical protein SMF913_28894 [Streptomyces malaysiensis]